MGDIMTDVRAYRRNSDGTLDIVTVLQDCTGDYYAGQDKLYPTGESIALMGWPDAAVCVYRTWCGSAEILIPVQEEDEGAN